MRFQNVSISGLAAVDAPHRITSAAIGDRLAPTLQRFNLRPNLLEELTGIVARRFWPEGFQPSDAAALAGEQALVNSGVPREKLGLIINTSVCKDYIEPSVGALVHGKMKLPPSCLNFDIGNACLAFLNGMVVAGNMIERGQIDHALIVDGENSRSITEKTIERMLSPDCTVKTFRDNFATLTLGSGSVAMVLSRSDLAPEGHKFNGGVSLAATEYSHLCRGQLDEMITDASKLLVAGIGLAQQTWEQAQQHLGWTPELLDECVLHQVSRTHTEQLCATLGLDMERVLAIYDEYGNIGPAGVPTVLAKAEAAGRLTKGKRVALMGIGSGLNVAMMEVVW
jgi:3-oxoacyl-[acyl-carrier-protein] synthase III